MTIRVQRVQWKDRDALSMSNGSMQAIVLAGGGHIAELRLLEERGSSINLLWEAPWATADPGSSELNRLSTLYGGMPAGPFLAGFTGHALCLDTFGPPAQHESDQGIALHGEAAAQIWKLEATPDGCKAEAYLPHSQLHISRSIVFDSEQSLLFVEEKLQNRGDAAREVHWVQHVSLGPPFLETGHSAIHATVDRCQAWPLGYEGRELLVADSKFDWPYAPRVNGGALDLRIPLQQSGTGFVAAARVVQDSEIASIAAMNHVLGIALIYCFRRKDFPWVAIWEENQARKEPPWNGIAQVRGMEFGTTPMPLGKEAIHAMGQLFDSPVACVLPPHGTRAARYIVCAARVPNEWRGLEAVRITEEGVALLRAEQEQTVWIPAIGVKDFLSEEIT